MRFAISALSIAKPQLLGLLVDRGFGNQLSEQLAIEPAGACLIGRNRPPDLASQLLQAVVIELAKLLDRYFGAADRGHRVASKAAEYVADAPDRETDRDDAHHDSHYGLAEPGRGGFVNTAKHACAISGLNNG